MKRPKIEMQAIVYVDNGVIAGINTVAADPILRNKALDYARRKRERDFLATMSHWYSPPSERQLRWLNAIAARLGVGGVA